MRDALMVAGLIGLALFVRQWQASRDVVPGAAPETSATAVQSFLRETGSPDSVLGATNGYGPLRSAWG